MTERMELHDSHKVGAGRAAVAEPPEAHAHERRPTVDPVTQVRTSDIEPYIGLRYLSKLFRLMAIILVLVLIGEVVSALMRGIAPIAVPTLLGEVSRLIVLSGLLWGAGDLAILLIDVGHDVRAARILLGRQVAHQLVEQRVPLPHEAEPAPGGDTR